MTVSTPPPPPPFSVYWMAFEPCCGGNTLYFAINGTTNPPSEGINIYNGAPVFGYEPINGTFVALTYQCYRLYIGTSSDPTSPINGTNLGNLDVVPTNIPSNYTWDSTTNDETPCGGEVITCPSCPTQMYDLWPCDGALVPVTTDTDLSLYVDGFVLIQVTPGGDFDCYYVTSSTNAMYPITVVPDGDVPCSCDCTCYEIIGTAKLSYVDCDGNALITTVNGYWKDCSLVYPVTSPAPGPNLIITNNGDCVDGQCADQCFELTDCNGLLDPIYTTAQSLSPYATLGQTVVIQGYDNCWTVTDVVLCDCAIDVVVTQAYADCPTCTAGPNYILTNCDDLRTIIYTSDDLSVYVGQVVELSPDCPGCWIVDVFPNAIPSDVPITITSAFDDCEACKTTYYVLEDCLGIEADIITSTDLSTYIDQIITLEWCPNICWTVSLSPTSTGAGNLGNISGQFAFCEQCTTSFPCVCSTVRNDNTIEYEYRYVDCYGVVQDVLLQPGETSDRICLIRWLEPEDCNCLVYTYTDDDSGVITAIIYASGEIINGRPSWSHSLGALYIYYNGTQWIINDSMEQPAYALPPSDSYCPEGTWDRISSIPLPPQYEATITTVKCQAYYTFYGECNNGVCPPVVYPKRSLKPGYNTPSCSTRRYEEISCRAAEAMYKQVLTLRYGISNCCPEDDLKYLIQKELIDLKALVNPDYICATPSCGCGCQGSCGCGGNCGGNCGGGCGCNSTPITCQS